MGALLRLILILNINKIARSRNPFKPP